MARRPGLCHVPLASGVGLLLQAPAGERCLCLGKDHPCFSIHPGLLLCPLFLFRVFPAGSSARKQYRASAVHALVRFPVVYRERHLFHGSSAGLDPLVFRVLPGDDAPPVLVHYGPVDADAVRRGRRQKMEDRRVIPNRCPVSPDHGASPLGGGLFLPGSPDPERLSPSLYRGNAYGALVDRRGCSVPPRGGRRRADRDKNCAATQIHIQPSRPRGDLFLFPERREGVWKPEQISQRVQRNRHDLVDGRSVLPPDAQAPPGHPRRIGLSIAMGLFDRLLCHPDCPAHFRHRRSFYASSRRVEVCFRVSVVCSSPGLHRFRPPACIADVEVFAVVGTAHRDSPGGCCNIPFFLPLRGHRKQAALSRRDDRAFLFRRAVRQRPVSRKLVRRTRQVPQRDSIRGGGHGGPAENH